MPSHLAAIADPGERAKRLPPGSPALAAAALLGWMTAKKANLTTPYSKALEVLNLPRGGGHRVILRMVAHGWLAPDPASPDPADPILGVIRLPAYGELRIWYKPSKRKLRMGLANTRRMKKAKRAADEEVENALKEIRVVRPPKETAATRLLDFLESQVPTGNRFSRGDLMKLVPSVSARGIIRALKLLRETGAIKWVEDPNRPRSRLYWM